MTETFSNPASGARDASARYVRSLLEVLGDRDPIEVQSQLAVSIERATAGLSLAQLRQPEKPGKWSVIEVVQHLADSEIVTAYRIRMILAGDTPDIQAYDQDAWAQRLRYAQASLPDALTQIRVLRGRSLDLLDWLQPDEWERAGMHSERGRESVRHITTLQAGHDLVHLRQIMRIKSAIGAA
jgi:DinB superfamily